MTLKLIRLSLLVLLFSCGKKISSTQSDNPTTIGGKVFSMKTTECNGECPVFEFNVFENGNYQFTGTKYVNQDKSEGQLPDGSYDSLMAVLDEIDFFTMKVINDSKIKDLPSYYFMASKDSVEKSILYYYPRNEKLSKLINYNMQLLNQLGLVKSN